MIELPKIKIRREGKPRGIANELNFLYVNRYLSITVNIDRSIDMAFKIDNQEIRVLGQDLEVRRRPSEELNMEVVPVVTSSAWI